MRRTRGKIPGHDPLQAESSLVWQTRWLSRSSVLRLPSLAARPNLDLQHQHHHPTCAAVIGSPRGLRLLGFTVGSLLLVATGCNIGATDVDGVRNGSARVLAPQFKSFAIEAPNTLSVVEVYTAEMFVAEGPGALIGAVPSSSSASIEVLGTRVSFLRNPSGTKQTAAGYPGTLCLQAWPPGSFGPTYEVEGLHFDAGDIFAVILAIRAPVAGTHVARGVIMNVVTNGVQSQVTSDAVMIELVRASDVSDLPQGRTCDPTQPNPWFVQ